MMTDEESDVMLSLLLQLGPPYPTSNCHWDGKAIGKQAITKMKRCINCKMRHKAVMFLLDLNILLDTKYYSGTQDGVGWVWSK